MDPTAVPTKASDGYLELWTLCVTGQVPLGWTNTSWRDDQQGRIVPQITRMVVVHSCDSFTARARIFGDSNGDLAYEVTREEAWCGHPYVVVDGVRQDLQGALDATTDRLLMYMAGTQDVGSTLQQTTGGPQELGTDGNPDENSSKAAEAD